MVVEVDDGCGGYVGGNEWWLEREELVEVIRGGEEYRSGKRKLFV